MAFTIHYTCRFIFTINGKSNQDFESAMQIANHVICKTWKLVLSVPHRARCETTTFRLYGNFPKKTSLPRLEDKGTTTSFGAEKKAQNLISHAVINELRPDEDIWRERR